MYLSYKLPLLLIAYPVGIALCLWGLKKLFTQWAKNKKQQQKATFYIPVVGSIAWTLFAIYLLVIFALINTTIFLGIFAILFFLNREFLQNFFTGILFRLEKGDLRGVSITIQTDEGVVFSYGITKLCLKSGNGNSVYVPYEKLYRKGFVRHVKVERSEVQTLKVFLSKNQEIIEEKIAQIHKKVLLNPYIVANENIQLLKGEDNGKKWLQITYTLANPKRAEAVKQELEQAIMSLE